MSQYQIWQVSIPQSGAELLRTRLALKSPLYRAPGAAKANLEEIYKWQAGHGTSMRIISFNNGR
jgi:hypothetical protein